MPSDARGTFNENVTDVERLIELHEEFSGTEPGRRVGVEVLNKAAVVLMCAAWEAYIEDLAAEVVEHYVHKLSDTSKLPKDLRETVAAELEKQSSKVAVWKLAGSGWKQELRNRLKGLREQRNLSMNTPKTAYVKAFFERAIGVPDVPGCWSWPNMTPERAGRKLDEYVALRGGIAHRGAAAESVRKFHVEQFRSHATHLVQVTDRHVFNAVKSAVGSRPYRV